LKSVDDYKGSNTSFLGLLASDAKIWNNKASQVMFCVRKYLWANTIGYSSVHDVQDENAGANLGKHFQQHRLRIPPIWKIILVAILLVSIISVGIFIIQSTKGNQLTDSYSCGNSSSEALALGCSFDHLTWSWYPPHCPHYTNGLFRTAEPDPFHYYETLESTVPIDEGDLFELIESQGGVWVEKREHLTHCVYMLLAQAQIIRDGTRHVPILTRYGHMEHCANLLLETLRRDDEWYHKNAFTPHVHYDQNC
jgi:hypothetical protein